MAAKIQDLVKRAREQPESAEAPGRFRTSTLITAVGGAVGAGVAFSSSKLLGEDLASVSGLLMFLGMPILAIAGLAGLIMMAHEALSSRDRTTPKGAVKTYYAAIGIARWDLARSCLSWVARSPVTTPAMPAVGLDRKEFSLADAGGLRDHWVYIGYRGRETRYARDGAWSVGDATAVEPGVALVSVSMTISVPRMTIPVGEGAARFGSVDAARKYRVPVYERDGLWYILDGGVTD